MSDSKEISDSSSFVSSSEYDSSFEDEIDVEKGGFYGCEPEYSEKELIDIISSQEDNADILSSSSEDEAESSRLENLHWCRCKNCVIGLDFTLEECLCCKECGILTQKMEGINCITEHKDFNNLILNSSVLDSFDEMYFHCFSPFFPDPTRGRCTVACFRDMLQL